MKAKLAAGLLVLASTTAGVAQASPNMRGPHVIGKGMHGPRQLLTERVAATKPAKRPFVKRSGQRAVALNVTVLEPERPRHRQVIDRRAIDRRAIDAEDRHSGLPGRALIVHNDGADPDAGLAATTPGSRLVAEARRWIGTNPTARPTLWCARFMNFVLNRMGLPGTASDLAKSFASYGKPLQEPEVGAIAVMSRGKGGGHVGVVSGFDKDGDPIIVSGNYSHRVAEAVYARSRIFAYVSPDI